MKLVYRKKFDGNMDSLEHGEHKPGAVMFRESESPKRFALLMNLLSIAVFGFFLLLLWLRGCPLSTKALFYASALTMLSIFPHELLHALCFRETVYLYTYLPKGMVFVLGPETMSKIHFVLMSLLPNLLFGFLPFAVWCFVPNLSVLGFFSALSIAAGVGDYTNIFHALTQMPKGARTYLYGFHSYWYLPEKEALK